MGAYTYQKGNEASSGKITYIHTNYLGTPVLETDDRGDIVQMDITDVFGNYVQRDQRKDNAYHNKGYTSHEYDDTTNLTYVHARYMDTRMHSFMSVDPMLYKLPQSYLTDPQQMNSYAYARNNPIIYTDPDGKFINLGAALIGAIVGGVIGAGVAAYNNQSIIKGAGIGAATGAVGGLTFGASLIATGAVGFGASTFTGVMSAGTMAGMTGYLTGSGLSGNAVTMNGLLSSGVGGGLTSGLFKGAGSAISSLSGKGATQGSSGYNVTTVGPTTDIKTGVATISRGVLPSNVSSSLNNLESKNWRTNRKDMSNGGRYNNTNELLPTNTTYKKFDVADVKPKGDERFILGDDGSIYYTNNHYGDVKNGYPEFMLITQ